MIEGGNTEGPIYSDKIPINADQVAWLLEAFNRYIPQKSTVGIDRQKEMLRYGLLYEVIEIIGLKFADGSARWNATPADAREPINVPEEGIHNCTFTD